MKKATPPRIEKFPAPKQRRLDALLDKNSEGTITAREKDTLARLVAEAERLMIENAKRLAAFTKAHSTRAAKRGTPVTLWVHSEGAGK
jgi:hypothetical protein